MALRLVFLAYGICVLFFLHATLAGSLDQQSSKEAELKATLLSRQNVLAPEKTVGTQNEERGEEKETVHKVEDKGNIIDIKVGDQLIEQYVQDCEQGYELIIMNSDGTSERNDVCYMHKMDKMLYDSVITGTGDKKACENAIANISKRLNKVQENSDITGEEKVAVRRVDSDRTMLDITVDNTLIEQKLLDCKQGYELITMNSEKNDVCYMHKMDKALYDSVCKGNGDKHQKFYYVKQEVQDKDFLSEDGPDSACKTRPIYMISRADNLEPDDEEARVLISQERRCST